MTAPAQRRSVGGPVDDDAYEPGELACAWCGCTEENACIDEDTGETCAWADGGVGEPACCTFCALMISRGQELNDPGNPVLAAADAFNRGQGLWIPNAQRTAAAGPLLVDAYGRPWQNDNDNDGERT